VDPTTGYVPFDLLPILGTALIATLATCWLKRHLLPTPRRGEWRIGVLLLFALLCLVVYLYATSTSDLGASRSGRPAGPRGTWTSDARPGDSAASCPPETARW